MTIDQIRERMTASKAAADAVITAAKEDGDRDLTADESAQIDERIAEFNAAKSDLAAAQEHAARLRAVDAMSSTPLPARTTDNPAANGSSAEFPAGTRITDPTPPFGSDPMRGFKSHRDFLTAVVKATTRRDLSDPRLRELCGTTVNDSGLRAAAGSDEQSTFSDPYGGFLVPEGMSPGVLATAFEGDPLASYTRKIPMDQPVVNFPARVDKTHTSSVSGGLRVYRRAEGDTSSTSRTQYETVKLEATGLFGVTHVTEELIMDSPTAFAAILEAGFREEFASRMLDERIRGTGVGEFQGVLNAACTVSAAKESGQDATTVNFANIVKMRARCWGYQNAVWLANHDVIPQLAQLNTNTTHGVPIWFPTATSDIPDLLMGRPLLFTEFCETLGTVGDVILGNWSQYLEGTYQPAGMAESIHVRFVNHERTFKFFARNAGTPWWRAALTVRKGANTLSPFVTLATRS